jgi:hypothetical protein
MPHLLFLWCDKLSRFSISSQNVLGIDTRHNDEKQASVVPRHGNTNAANSFIRLIGDGKKIVFRVFVQSFLFHH